jgi:flagellar protein FlbD
VIKLTRLDNQEIAINCDLIVWIEARPDTIVRLIAGETILVRESVDDVIARIVAHRSGILHEAGLGALVTAGSLAAAAAALEVVEREHDELMTMEQGS